MRMYNVHETSIMLGVAYTTVRKWISENRMFPDAITGVNGRISLFKIETVDAIKEELQEYDRPKIKETNEKEHVTT